MSWLRAVVVVSLLLAGCASVPEDVDPVPDGPAAWEPAACDPSGATTIGNNAPPVEGLQGTDEDVAERVAGAFGDDLVSKTPVDATDGFARWTTTSGFVQVSHHDGSTQWEATTSHGDLPSEETLRAGLEELGAPASSLQANEYSPGMLQQVWEGHVLTGASSWYLKGQGDPAPMGRYGSFSLGALVETPGPLQTIPDADLLETARAYDRCAMDEDGLTEAAGYNHTGIQATGYGVQHDSLVREIYVRYTEPQESHCGFSRGVAVDIVTGAVHGPVTVYCD